MGSLSVQSISVASHLILYDYSMITYSVNANIIQMWIMFCATEQIKQIDKDISACLQWEPNEGTHEEVHDGISF